MINEKTSELLKKARLEKVRFNDSKKIRITPPSYLELISDEYRHVTVRAAARKAMRCNKEAIELLADL